MNAYIAILRGINVSGKNIIKMTALREACAAIGFGEVKTYVQSGNVVFRSDQPRSSLAKQFGEMLRREFSFDGLVLIKNAKEWSVVAEKNPFLKEKGIDASKLHVTFLSEAVSPAARKKLAKFPETPDRFRILGREIYLHCPDGYGRTKFTNNAFEKALSVQATTRNWNTVSALLEMAMEPQ